MSILKILYARGTLCGISDDSIKKLNLYTLDITNNMKVTNTSFMTNLVNLIK